MDEFPGNSRSKPTIISSTTPEPAEPQERKLDPVVTGNVTKRKTPLGKRLMKTFFSGDSDSVLGYLLRDVLVPAVQAIIHDVATQGLERALYGEVRSPSRSIRGNPVRGNMTNYQGVSTVRPSIVGRPTVPSRPSMQSSIDLGEIVLDSQIETQVVMDRLYETVENYKSVSVANLYELLNEPTNYTDHKWGWTNLTQMTARPYRGGYLLMMPPPEDLDRR